MSSLITGTGTPRAAHSVPNVCRLSRARDNRHSLATTMVRRGASFAEIGQVLRHRSANTTEIYAKLDFDSLRDVAMPWPASRGVR